MFMWHNEQSLNTEYKTPNVYFHLQICYHDYFYSGQYDWCLILYRVQSHRASVCSAKGNYWGSVAFYCCYFNIVMSLLNKTQVTFSTIYNKQVLIFKFKISSSWTLTHHTSLAGTACYCLLSDSPVICWNGKFSSCSMSLSTNQMMCWWVKEATLSLPTFLEFTWLSQWAELTEIHQVCISYRKRLHSAWHGMWFLIYKVYFLSSLI